MKASEKALIIQILRRIEKRLPAEVYASQTEMLQDKRPSIATLIILLEEIK